MRKILTKQGKMAYQLHFCCCDKAMTKATSGCQNDESFMMGKHRVCRKLKAQILNHRYEAERDKGKPLVDLNSQSPPIVLYFL